MNPYRTLFRDYLSRHRLSVVWLLLVPIDQYFPQVPLTFLCGLIGPALLQMDRASGALLASQLTPTARSDLRRFAWFMAVAFWPLLFLATHLILAPFVPGAFDLDVALKSVLLGAGWSALAFTIQALPMWPMLRELLLVGLFLLPFGVGLVALVRPFMPGGTPTLLPLAVVMLPVSWFAASTLSSRHPLPGKAQAESAPAVPPRGRSPRRFRTGLFLATDITITPFMLWYGIGCTTSLSTMDLQLTLTGHPSGIAFLHLTKAVVVFFLLWSSSGQVLPVLRALRTLPVRSLTLSTTVVLQSITPPVLVIGAAALPMYALASSPWLCETLLGNTALSPLLARFPLWHEMLLNLSQVLLGSVLLIPAVLRLGFFKATLLVIACVALFSFVLFPQLPRETMVAIAVVAPAAAFLTTHYTLRHSAAAYRHRFGASFNSGKHQTGEVLP